MEKEVTMTGEELAELCGMGDLYRKGKEKQLEEETMKIINEMKRKIENEEFVDLNLLIDKRLRYLTLENEKESMPQWLEEYKVGERNVDLREILSHRVLFYPGSGNDGQPIKAFNQSHAVHTYLYSDYLIDIDQAISLFKTHKIKGYKLFDLITLNIEELLPKNIDADMWRDNSWNKEYPNKFCTICIYERKEEFDDSHGAKRFALIYTNEDAYRVFNVVYHPENNLPNPFAIVLQEHGFGGNYDKWGKGGLLERIAKRYNIFPKYYIIGENTIPWENSYSCNDNIMSGGNFDFTRELYIHKS